jgi:hypothetical protein
VPSPSPWRNGGWPWCRESRLDNDLMHATHPNPRPLLDSLTSALYPEEDEEQGRAKEWSPKVQATCLALQDLLEKWVLGRNLARCVCEDVRGGVRSGGGGGQGDGAGGAVGPPRGPALRVPAPRQGQGQGPGR